ncbi:MAG TPA: acyl-CoA dehydrogenase family protein [Dehalococcoidia bacterium]|nr:acyl-CoA dehydrogenase family protein [Dehalococcoidia bacterium]
MDFKDGPADAAFRTEVREFLRVELPDDFRAADDVILGVGIGEDERERDWLRTLAKRGWVAPAWPKAYGGAGMSVMQQFIFNEEMARARAPRPNFLAIGLAGPTIIVHGTEEQKREHLSGILSGETFWCQGFSEPGSGSDLASLQTRAVQDGDDFIINGQKIWTSGAHRAQRMMLLARTDTELPKHKGISYFLVDMKSPGISVRPLTNMADTPSFNEVFFDNVRVPKKDVLGELNRGWYVATTTLDFERSGIISGVGLQRLVQDIVGYARAHHRADRGWATVRHELADRAIETEIAIVLSYRVVTMQAQGLVPNQEASINKLFGSELAQRIARTGVKVASLYGQLREGSAWATDGGRMDALYRISIGSTLAGGTSEIQRGVIAQRGLGLPRG